MAGVFYCKITLGNREEMSKKNKGSDELWAALL